MSLLTENLLLMETIMTDDVLAKYDSLFSLCRCDMFDTLSVDNEPFETQHDMFLNQIFADNYVMFDVYRKMALLDVSSPDPPKLGRL